jgi:hypothetical protein
VTAVDLEVSEDLADVIKGVRDFRPARPVRSTVASLISDPRTVAVVITLMQGPLTVAELAQIGRAWLTRLRLHSQQEGKLHARGPGGSVDLDIDESTDFDAVGRALAALLFPHSERKLKSFDADDLDD